MKYLFQDHETAYRINASSLQKVIGYIEHCHLEDGGYFFARVPPSSGMDTYFAVKSLSILGIKPKQSKSILNFFLNRIKDNSLGGITGLFSAAEVINDLGQMTEDISSYIQQWIPFLQNKVERFVNTDNTDVEIPSELEESYRAAKILKIIGSEFDKEKTIHFIYSLLNPDGGYGNKRYSVLSSTYYAIEIQKLLGATNMAKFAKTKDYLRIKEENWDIYFIEDLSWLFGSLVKLGEKPISKEKALKFVMACQRLGGGFSRASTIGIPTLEYTFYALSVLKNIGIL